MPPLLVGHQCNSLLLVSTTVEPGCAMSLSLVSQVRENLNSFLLRLRRDGSVCHVLVGPVRQDTLTVGRDSIRQDTL